MKDNRFSLFSPIYKGGTPMNIINQAIIFATKAHEGQFRKATTIPYITHPYAVGMLLQKVNCSDEVIAAGILHDTLEDTETTFEELVEQFGSRVAELVLAVSEEDKTLPWEERKQRTIDALPQADINIVHIITADKLHNLRSIRADLEIHGEDVWKRFNREKSAQSWYYRNILKALLPRKKDCALIRKLEKEVQTVFETNDDPCTK